MKLIVIFVVMCVVLCNGLKKEREQGRQIAMVLLKDCKNKEGGTDADMDTLAGEQIPTTTSGQCMLACVYEKIDIFDKGVFHRENFLELARVLTDNHEKKMSYIEQFANDCGGIQGDRCTQAGQFTKCVHDGLTAVMHEDFDIV